MEKHSPVIYRETVEFNARISTAVSIDVAARTGYIELDFFSRRPTLLDFFPHFFSLFLTFPHLSSPSLGFLSLLLTLLTYAYFSPRGVTEHFGSIPPI
jgi:hypothetical protein